MIKHKLLLGYSICVGIFRALGFLLIRFIETNDETKKIDLITKEDFEKMYRIIEIKGGIDKEPWKRKISSKVVKKFCKIALANKINLDLITDKQFDFIYCTYTDYLIDKYKN